LCPTCLSLFSFAVLFTDWLVIWTGVCWK
jgi:hypothetical protein